MAANTGAADAFATVILSATYPRPDLQYPERRVRLDSRRRTLHIGRHSKSRPERAAAVDNGLFDSPVMSREHSVITADFDKKRLYLKDIGSLHGTFINGERLLLEVPQRVMNGDVVRFGIDIMSGNTNFPPLAVEINYYFEDNMPAATSTTPVVYQVPDDSEDENSTDESELESVVEWSRSATKLASSAHIDLTAGESTSTAGLHPKVTDQIDLTSGHPASANSQAPFDVADQTLDAVAMPSQTPALGSDTIEATQALLSVAGQSPFWPDGPGGDGESINLDPEDALEDDVENDDFANVLNDEDQDGDGDSYDDEDDIALSPSEAFDPDDVSDGTDVDDSRDSNIYDDSSDLGEENPFLAGFESNSDSTDYDRSQRSVVGAEEESATRAPLPTPKISIAMLVTAPAAAKRQSPTADAQRLPQIADVAPSKFSCAAVTAAPTVSKPTASSLMQPALLTVAPPCPRPCSQPRAPPREQVQTSLPVYNEVDIPLAETALTISAEDFISRPLPPLPLEGPLVDQEDYDDGLNMSSAYEFELSKLSKLAKARQAGSSHLEDTIMEKVANSLKRKADHISRLTPDEEVVEAESTPSPKSDAALEPKTPQSKSLVDDVVVVGEESISPSGVDNTPEAARPSKRLRKVAEAAAYVVLGSAATGVALLSALIATAPSFT